MPDLQSTVNGVFRIFIFQRQMSSFLLSFFSAARLSTVCIYTLLFCFVCLGMEWEQPNGNPMGLGIRLKRGNGDEKKWKVTA